MTWSRNRQKFKPLPQRLIHLSTAKLGAERDSLYSPFKDFYFKTSKSRSSPPLNWLLRSIPTILHLFVGEEYSQILYQCFHSRWLRGCRAEAKLRTSISALSISLQLESSRAYSLSPHPPHKLRDLCTVCSTCTRSFNHFVIFSIYELYIMYSCGVFLRMLHLSLGLEPPPLKSCEEWCHPRHCP